MISGLNETPKAMRIHIGIFGSVNAGKSTLVNAVTGQNVSITSSEPGTTTDPVYKPMELAEIGPAVFIDTAGFGDRTSLGASRTERTLSELDRCDMAVYVISDDDDPAEYANITEMFAKKNIPLLFVVNIKDKTRTAPEAPKNTPYICIDLTDGNAGKAVREALISLLKSKTEPDPPMTADLVKAGDIVLLCAPQDKQAPKGRLILPEVQTIRDLLDNMCMVMTVTPENITAALDSLNRLPDLVVTDSQIFAEVNAAIPESVRLTSFSVLMAKIKGDLPKLIDGAKTISSLTDGDRVLIIESCSHHAQKDDIAREKLPRLLKKFTGKSLEITVSSGQTLPDDLSEYTLAIHCGGCMINRRSMLAKQEKAASLGIPMTNFGIAIAYMNGIFDRICY